MMIGITNDAECVRPQPRESISSTKTTTITNCVRVFASLSGIKDLDAGKDIPIEDLYPNIVHGQRGRFEITVTFTPAE